MGIGKMKELDLFKEIWLERIHYSELTGKPLSFYQWHSQFAHILPKGKYPEARLDKENIILLTPEEHSLYDAGTEDQRIRYAQKNGTSWDKLYKKRDKLKNKYVSR